MRQWWISLACRKAQIAKRRNTNGLVHNPWTRPRLRHGIKRIRGADCGSLNLEKHSPTSARSRTRSKYSYNSKSLPEGAPGSAYKWYTEGEVVTTFSSFRFSELSQPI